MQIGNLEIYGYTIPKYDKEKNGDHYLIEELKEESLLMALVADGVSRQPCDWKASSTACKGFAEGMLVHADLEMKARMTASLQHAHLQLLGEEGACNGMVATLIAMVVDIASGQFYLVNVGDSRVYTIIKDEVVQSTKDDFEVREQRVMTATGFKTIQRKILNKGIGQDITHATIETGKLKPETWVLLTSDGFYEARKGSFNKKLLSFAQSKEGEKAFQEMVDSFTLFRGDDLTVIAMKFVPIRV